MAAIIKTILHLTPFYSPNLGGVETHLNDLTSGLQQLGYQQIVLTYSPLTTKASYRSTEESPGLIIRRFKYIGYNLFYRLESLPFLNFIYLTPYLLFRSFFWLIAHHPKIDVIHSHGLNGAVIGLCLQYIFNIPKHVVSIYSTYDHVPLNSLSSKLTLFILNHTNRVLTQSDQSVAQLGVLGVNPHLISRYYHWVDLTRFKPSPSAISRFTVLFIGRMIPHKNVLIIGAIAKILPSIRFIFVGTGPDYSKLQKITSSLTNVDLVGDIPYSSLHLYYQKSHILVVPSKYHEGWGRVIAESIACGTPVITSNLGGTAEAADNSVAIFVTPTYQNFLRYIRALAANDHQYQQLKRKCRPFARRHFSLANLRYVTKHY